MIGEKPPVRRTLLGTDEKMHSLAELRRVRQPAASLPLLPPAPMPRLAAGGPAEDGFARGGWLEDAALRIRSRIVGRGFARRRAAGAIGQRFRAVHFVEVGFVDARGAASTARGMPLTPTLSPRRAGRGGRGAGRWGVGQPG